MCGGWEFQATRRMDSFADCGCTAANVQALLNVIKHARSWCLQVAKQRCGHLRLWWASQYGGSTVKYEIYGMFGYLYSQHPNHPMFIMLIYVDHVGRANHSNLPIDTVWFSNGFTKNQRGSPQSSDHARGDSGRRLAIANREAEFVMSKIKMKIYMIIMIIPIISNNPWREILTTWWDSNS